MIYIAPANHYNLWVDGKTTEKVYCEKVANKIKSINSGVYVATVSNNGDYTGRPEEAKEKGCDTYLAIHTNAYVNGVKTTGCVAFYHPENSKSKELAEKLVEAMDSICPIESNRSKSVQLPRCGFGRNSRAAEAWNYSCAAGNQFPHLRTDCNLDEREC